jgi:hypothetical protein
MRGRSFCVRKKTPLKWTLDVVEFFLGRRLKRHVAMTVPGVVHQEINARCPELNESVFHAFDEGSERCDVAGV